MKWRWRSEGVGCGNRNFTIWKWKGTCQSWADLERLRLGRSSDPITWPPVDRWKADEDCGGPTRPFPTQLITTETLSKRRWKSPWTTTAKKFLRETGWLFTESVKTDEPTVMLRSNFRRFDLLGLVSDDFRSKISLSAWNKFPSDNLILRLTPATKPLFFHYFLISDRS